MALLAFDLIHIEIHLAVAILKSNFPSVNLQKQAIQIHVAANRAPAANFALCHAPGNPRQSLQALPPPVNCDTLAMLALRILWTQPILKMLKTFRPAESFGCKVAKT